MRRMPILPLSNVGTKLYKHTITYDTSNTQIIIISNKKDIYISNLAIGLDIQNIIHCLYNANGYWLATIQGNEESQKLYFLTNTGEFGFIQLGNIGYHTFSDSVEEL